MLGFTRCQRCLRVVKVRDDGTLNYHVSGTWEDTCPGFKSAALWVDKNKLSAGGRNSSGVCMRCGETEENPECPQCCFEKRWENG